MEKNEFKTSSRIEVGSLICGVLGLIALIAFFLPLIYMGNTSTSAYSIFVGMFDPSTTDGLAFALFIDVNNTFIGNLYSIFTYLIGIFGFLTALCGLTIVVCYILKISGIVNAELIVKIATYLGLVFSIGLMVFAMVRMLELNGNTNLYMFGFAMYLMIVAFTSSSVLKFLKVK